MYTVLLLLLLLLQWTLLPRPLSRVKGDKRRESELGRSRREVDNGILTRTACSSVKGGGKPDHVQYLASARRDGLEQSRELVRKANTYHMRITKKRKKERKKERESAGMEI